jgi:CheY-like chemotaxis protein
MKNKKKARIRFVVFDSGIGIPEDKQMTIFDMFTQVDSSFTRKYGGTGLGLSISNRILEQMGSRMIIESEMGKGSVFSFELELETVNLKPKGKDEKALKNEIRTICEKKMTILIVEDDLINAKLAKTVIKKNLLNSVVISAGDGQEGVEKYFEYSPDLVLMDLHMPVKNGFEALKEIRSREKEGRKAMIIALTADAREDRAKHCLESGFDEYISKPFEKDILMEKILRLCKQE